MNLVQVQHPKWWSGGHSMDIRVPGYTGLGRTWPLRAMDNEDSPVNIANVGVGRTSNRSMSDQK